MEINEQKNSDETYRLSEDERENLLESEVDNLSDTLSGYQMNTEMQSAWVSAIVPPDREMEGAPRTRDRIAVEFMLPSGDVFWETFDFPNKRWPENNEFRKFIESLGHYSPDNLFEVVGEEVDTVYDERLGRWTVEGEFGEEPVDESEESSGDFYRKALMYASAVVLLPVCAGLILRLRHIGLILILIVATVAYVGYKVEMS